MTNGVSPAKAQARVPKVGSAFRAKEQGRDKMPRTRDRNREYVAQVTLSKSDFELIRDGLQCRICFIETSTGHLRAADCPEKAERGEAKPNRLNTDQMRLIVEMEDLIKHVQDSLIN